MLILSFGGEESLMWYIFSCQVYLACSIFISLSFLFHHMSVSTEIAVHCLVFWLCLENLSLLGVCLLYTFDFLALILRRLISFVTRSCSWPCEENFQIWKRNQCGSGTKHDQQMKLPYHLSLSLISELNQQGWYAILSYLSAIDCMHMILYLFTKLHAYYGSKSVGKLYSQKSISHKIQPICGFEQTTSLCVTPTP